MDFVSVVKQSDACNNEKGEMEFIIVHNCNSASAYLNV